MINNFPETARVWIYQAARPFGEAEAPEVQNKLQQFATQWVSHNRQLRASGEVLHNRFLVLAVDESLAGASGCSIDKSVAFLKSLQAEYDTDFFNRMLFSYLDKGQVETVSREEFALLYAEGHINDATPVFDTLVATKGDFETSFIKPLGESWHRRMV
ncbi:MAG: hypothetical protein KF852_07595 [Saprospiraceae bacterium]|nr:hypothetical protein [Saprospiraceae bacterium]